MAGISGHYISKEATQQEKFLQKCPTYDGRNVVIAILDTGVDPSCEGLQTTSTGSKKVTGCYDFTGAGDVDTSTIKRVDGNGMIIGLTERELKIPVTWKNPSGNWHLGIKSIHELYTPEIREKDKIINNTELVKQTRILIAETKKEASKSVLTEDDKKDSDAKLEYLEAAKLITSESPVADCIVWNDGERWKACLDLSFCGDLDKAKVMSSFCENQEYGFISDKFLVSYCLNIYDEGKLLEICVPNGSHGTHVAHIAAGHFHGEPEKDGLAPGAQIVSLCIGDMRKGTYLTEQALLRALEKCRQLKVDVINFSYGASPNCVDSGNISKIITDIVQKYGIIFVAAAGNDGPNLTTMGFASGKVHHSVINVGAYLTGEIKKEIYGHSGSPASIVYPFSSRGPCLDGTWGVCVSAPGAAVTGVSKHEMIDADLKYGTSMACPNVAGNIACLLSAMKAESIPISPFRVKLALMNSALMPEDGTPYCLGAGIIQLSAAYYFIKFKESSIPASINDIKVDINGKRGIYLRDPWETSIAQKMNVTVNTESDVGVSDDYLIQLNLSKGSPKWITYPSQCRLPSSRFPIEINPISLQRGKAHFAELVGISKTNPLLGPLFRIPITVILPEKVSKKTNFCYEKKLTLEPAIPQRIFIKAPTGSKYIAVEIRSLEEAKNIECYAQCVYIDFNQLVKQLQKISVIPKNSKHLYFSTLGNTILELSFTGKWKDCSASEICLKMEFYGFSIQHERLSTTNLTNRILFSNNLRSTEINPVVEFTEFCYPINPLDDATIESLLKERDTIDGNPSFRLLVKYNFYAANTGYYKFEHEGLTNYKAYIDCYLLQAYTSTKERIFTCSSAEKVELEKGNYVIHVQYRHTDNAALTYFQRSSLLVTEFIPTVVPLLFTDAGSAVYNDPEKSNNFFHQEKLFSKKVFAQGEKNEFYMQPLGQFPAIYPSGSYLKGNVILQSTNELKFFSSFVVTYSLANACYDQSGVINISCSTTDPEKFLSSEYYNESDQLLADAVDIGLSENNIQFLAACVENFTQIQNLSKTLAFYNVANFVLDEYLKTANDIPEIFQNKFNPRTENVEITQKSFYSNTSTTNYTIADTAKQLLSNMKSRDLLNSNSSSDNNKFFFAPNVNSDQSYCYPNDTELLYHDQNSLYNMADTSFTSDTDESFIMDYENYELLPKIVQKGSSAILEKLFQAYMLVADPNSENARIILTKYAVAHRRYGIALMELKKIMTDKTINCDYQPAEKAIFQLLKTLGWDHLADEAQKALLIKHQKFFRLF